MRIFKDKIFARFARQNNINDAALCKAIDRAERGLIDADLGGGVIKQRVPRPGEGRSGGYRTLIFFRQGERAFFVFGFAKSDRDNIAADDLKILKRAAVETLALSDEQIATLLDKESLVEVNCNDEEDLSE